MPLTKAETSILTKKISNILWYNLSSAYKEEENRPPTKKGRVPTYSWTNLVRHSLFGDLDSPYPFTFTLHHQNAFSLILEHVPHLITFPSTNTESGKPVNPERLVDFSIAETSYPLTIGEYKCSYTSQLMLACESEWGVENGEEKNLNAVLYDFQKLLDINSLIKIMVFSTFINRKNEHQTFFKAMDSLIRARPSSGVEWILIGLPWDDWLNDNIDDYCKTFTW